MPRWAAPAAVAAALLVGGCAGASPVEWSDGLCGSLAPLAATAGLAQPVNPTDLAATQQSQSATLVAAHDAADRTLTALRELGSSPVEGGDEIAASVTATVGGARATLSDALATLDAASPSDPIAFIAALEQAQRALTAVPATIDDARRRVAANTELRTAALGASRCQQVGVVEAPPAPAPPPAAPPTPTG